MDKLGGLKKLAPAVLAAAIVCVGAPAMPVAAAAPLTNVTIAMGYIPNVQFAPFYVAVAKGYYKSAGLNVHFDYATSTDVIRLVAAGNIAFGNAEGDQAIVGHARGLNVVSVLAQYQRFPVVIFSLAGSGIKSFSDLKGKTIGIPGLYGASYTGLLAALSASHLTTKDVKIDAIGYAQVAAVIQHRVDAAVGFAMNEPVQLRQRGYAVTVLPIDTVVPLTGPGVVAGPQEVRNNASLVRRFVAATMRGLRDTNANPSAALQSSRAFMPSMPTSQVAYQLAVLKEAIRYWTPAAGHHLGCASAATWASTASVLLQQHQIQKVTGITTLFTNTFVGGC